MEEFLPLLFVIFFWGLIGSVIRGSRKNQKNQKNIPRTRQGPAARKAGFPASSPDRETDSGTEPTAPAVREAAPSASVSFSRRLGDSGYGSLPGGSMEGVDPCHDDSGAMPAGSLSYRSEEGQDPCHDDWTPAAPSRTLEPDPNGEESSGLNLSWTGNDIVRGFICSEILKRKTG